MAAMAGRAEPGSAVPRFAMHEVPFTALGTYANPYVDLTADATLIEPDGQTLRRVPLFWDGGATWRFRFAPDKVGIWRWSVRSADRGLGGRQGEFACVPSELRGSIQPMAGAGHHFQYQNGERMWFLGDTAWAYLVDNREEDLNRATAERHAANRATQGFNAIHVMLLSEIGKGNEGGPPWDDIAREQLNPAYFRAADERIAFANARGLVTGIALAWGFKGRNELYSWSRMPDRAARERFARYAAARYGAYNVYFLVSGEWDTDIRWLPAPEAKVRQQYVRLGEVLRAADAQRRMIGIHPSQADGGSVRSFNTDAPWMDFGDYQQNYTQLHQNILASRIFGKPAINAEYAYWLRDADGDGRIDKAHSYTLEDIRAATWDIVMAGGYIVAGFGSTYLGGARHPTKILPDDPLNVPWLDQLAQVRQFFSGLDFWRLEPHDELLASAAARTADRSKKVEADDVQLTETRAPAVTYWCLADPGRTYVAYVRGTAEAVTVALATDGAASWSAEQFDPRSGERCLLAAPAPQAGRFEFRPPDTRDWLVVLRATQ